MAPEADRGFTLVELAVVMLILGVLSSIAIPVFTSQRAKARDAATKSDVVNLGQEVATYYVDGQGSLALDLDVEPGKAVLSDGRWSTTVNLTKGTASPASGDYRNLNVPDAWCVSLTDPAGQVDTYRFSASKGLEEGTC